ncbi:GAP family protein [Aldersonia kunmingensis]|uniref:GAP family protein n=1 Tax=Aldersonia kunmingensis TaxID=408066 RepID=UPI00082D71E9|nr:GAP family protein [Aldersonia kunmingensis]
MNSVIGELLPLAVGTALSPIPIIAAILILLAPNAKGVAVGFLFGWVIGIAVACSVFTLLSAVLPDEEGNSQPAHAWLYVGLGALLVIHAVRDWRSRPAGDAEPTMPKWMSAIDSFTAGRGIGLGFALAAVNPKNLILGAAAGVAIGEGGLSSGDVVVVIVVFTLLASCSVAVPVIAYLLSPQRWAGPLQTLREWLTRHNTAVMTVLLLVIGAVLIGKGLGKF